jgi:hypothetical protein
VVARRLSMAKRADYGFVNGVQESKFNAVGIGISVLIIQLAYI